MKFFDFRTLLSIAAALLVTACGGSDISDTTAQDAATAAPVTAANAPVADCEKEGFNRPRIVDGLAEQYRATAMAQQAAEPALQDRAPPAARQAGSDGAAATEAPPAEAAPTEAKPAAA
jgi:hypothetical protein